MEKAAIVYWSGTGNTEAMAESISSGMISEGIEVEVLTCADVTESMLQNFSKVAFGCPAMGEEVLEESEFEPMFCMVEPSLRDKKVALFGSYGWGEGEWMQTWQERVKADGAILFEEGLICNGSPEDSQCVDFGKRFASF